MILSAIYMMSRGMLMNLEQRERVYRSIQKLEGLLAYAVRHGETAEAERIRAELQKLVSGL